MYTFLAQVITEPLTYEQAEVAAVNNAIAGNGNVDLDFFIGKELDRVLDDLNELAVTERTLGNFSYTPIAIEEDGSLVIEVTGDLMFGRDN